MSSALRTTGRGVLCPRLALLPLLWARGEGAAGVGAPDGPTDDDKEEQEAADEEHTEPDAATAPPTSGSTSPCRSAAQSAEPCRSGKVLWHALTSSLDRKSTRLNSSH